MAGRFLESIRVAAQEAKVIPAPTEAQKALADVLRILLNAGWADRDEQGRAN
jgi:hypothetical protein